MDFWITIVGLLRRKRVIIPAVLIATAWGAAAYLGTPVSYETSTTMVLTTTEFGGTESQDPTKPTDLTNPMLNFNESLRTTSAILIEAMNTKDVSEKLGAVGSTQLIVNDGRTNPELIGLNGPFLYIVAQSTSSDEAERVVQEAQTVMREKLREWQRSLNAPEKTYVSLVDVVPPTAPVPGRGRATKLGLLAFIFGFLLTMGIAYFGHRIRARRRARAAAAKAVVDATRPPGESPGERGARRPSRPPELAPDEEEDEDAAPALVPTLLDKQAEPAVGPTAVEMLPRPAAVATPVTRSPQPVVVPTPLRKHGESPVVPAPVKRKVGSRGR